MNKIHIVIFYRTDGIEFIPPEIPAISDEDEVKDRVNLLNKRQYRDTDFTVGGLFGYITKELL